MPKWVSKAMACLLSEPATLASALPNDGWEDIPMVGVTSTTASHETLKAAGLEAKTSEELQASPEEVFPYVIFAAPPRSRKGSDPAGYIASIDEAITHWDADEEGGFVFTSSGGVLAEDDGATVTEDSLVSESDSAKTLLEAEKHVTTAQGTVLRLAGLYDLRRGAHSYWLKAGIIKGREDGLINLVHYDDAADAVIAALRGGSVARRNLFLVGDGTPMSRREIVESARVAPEYKDSAMPKFEGSPAKGGLGKVYDTSRVRKTLGWTPRYKSFGQYMSAQR